MFEELAFIDNPTDDREMMPIMPLDEDEEEDQSGLALPANLPLLPLKNTVLFPGIIIPITIGRDKSIKAVRQAHQSDKLLAVVSQKNMKVEDPSFKDMYQIGTVAKILKLFKMPDGTTTTILQGKRRFALDQLIQEDPHMEVQITELQSIPPEDESEFRAMVVTIRDLAAQIIKLSPNIPSEASVMLSNIKSDVFLLDFIASNLAISMAEKQAILEIGSLTEKAQHVLQHMQQEMQVLVLKDEIDTKVRGDIDKQQRDYFLHQQLKTIQEELGQNPQQAEIKELEERASKKKWPENVKKAFEKEITKVKRINPQVAEYSVLLNYLDLLLDLPWEEYTKDNFDLKKVKEVLDKDHYGLTKVKERIIEHLAVLKLKGDMKAPILCLVGPPGVGKTSLGRSIARALQRRFIRMSLGGLHDESEIRGHRKTYIGAMPGRIIQSLKKAESSNPVFILDEIDKVGKDFRGDPSSALLEVLDPEQNSTFHDNYLELEYDLSKVMFVATANSLASIQPALLDRMEIIEISGYSTEEKVEIAKRHLIPQQRKEHGLKANQITLRPAVLKRIIQDYTRESGVRSLSRRIAGVMRNAAKQIAMDDVAKVVVGPADLLGILGPSRFSKDLYTEARVPGVAVGLAWTSVGGEILFIEASLSDGSGKLTLTGNLGDVMKESASTALSFIKAHSEALGIDPARFAKTDLHVHVPEGAIPKDGPSAGVTMLTAITSVLSGKRVKSHLAMTGEITLRGRVLPVGGIKEKVLAAKRAGMKQIMLCAENEKHVDEINPDFIKDLNFVYVKTMEEVLEHALGKLKPKAK
ncbi:MAG: endopeptidase La [Saprospiraceae bacterium]|nr:endopeptidase La [Saprospiraceae bacterium]